MRVVFWMVTACFGSWAVAATLAPGHRMDVLFGMLGPLVAVAGTWLAIERTARVNPLGIAEVLLSGFVVKLLFFALYVGTVMLVARPDRVPFVVSFTTYFVVLYAAEALMLRRLTGRLTQ